MPDSGIGAIRYAEEQKRRLPRSTGLACAYDAQVRTLLPADPAPMTESPLCMAEYAWTPRKRRTANAPSGTARKVPAAGF